MLIFSCLNMQFEACNIVWNQETNTMDYGQYGFSTRNYIHWLRNEGSDFGEWRKKSPLQNFMTNFHWLEDFPDKWF